MKRYWTDRLNARYTRLYNASKRFQRLEELDAPTVIIDREKTRMMSLVKDYIQAGEGARKEIANTKKEREGN